MRVVLRDVKARACKPSSRAWKPKLINNPVLAVLRLSLALSLWLARWLAGWLPVWLSVYLSVWGLGFRVPKP